MGPSRLNVPRYPRWNNSQLIPESNPPYPYHNESRSSPIPLTVHHGRPTADEYTYPLHTSMSGPQNSSKHFSGANFMSGIGERETREIACGKLNYICEYCGKGFLRPSALKVRLDRNSNRKKSLLLPQTHVISHTGDQGNYPDVNSMFEFFLSTQCSRLLLRVCLPGGRLLTKIWNSQ